MCGIFGYTGKKKAVPILLRGIKTLEYRGYDSAGIFVSGCAPVRAVGEVKNVEEASGLAECVGKAGIAHTRWATHGVPSLRNTHPHTDCEESLYIVHNGIVENYKELRERLESSGHSFKSDTDTEVLAHLVEDALKKEASLHGALVRALKYVRGTYGIALMHKDFVEEIVVARMGSPIVLGIGKGEQFVASDPSAIIRYTDTMLYLEDGETAVLSPGGYKIFSSGNKTLNREPEKVDSDIGEIQKEGFEHFMLKEIMEAKDVFDATIRGRLDLKEGVAHLGGIKDVEEKLQNMKRLVIVGCGSAYYAGMVGKYMIEEHAGVPVDVEIASEYRYRAAPDQKDTVVLAISQSGETADTLACIKEAKRKGLLTLGIVNVVGSTIARESTAGVYNHAGPEVSVASTKAFISQLIVLVLLTLYLGRQRRMGIGEGRAIIDEMMKLPSKIQRIFDGRDDIELVANKYVSSRDFLYVGRKYNFALAYEGALKLKEVSYIHAEGYGAGEMKHGPLAMIDKDFPTFAIAPKDSVYEKNISNIEEIRARSGKVIALGTEGDMLLASLATDVIYVPKTIEMLSPILNVIPLQLFGYYMSVARGLNVDRPRNLAKAVTVE